jgi:hypothetical protein
LRRFVCRLLLLTRHSGILLLSGLRCGRGLLRLLVPLSLDFLVALAISLVLRALGCRGIQLLT